MTMNFDREVEERLLRYVKIDTTSDESSPTSPSTERQYDLLNLLVDELNEIGAQDVRLTDYGAVLATIPATIAGDAPVIALLAHVDTSPAYSGAGVKPLVHRNYQGGDIPLPDDPEQVLTYENSPYLKERIGDDIVTAGGTTLLGADDKAGVAEIMTFAERMLRPRENHRLAETGQRVRQRGARIAHRIGAVQHHKCIGVIAVRAQVVRHRLPIVGRRVRRIDQRVQLGEREQARVQMRVLNQPAQPAAHIGARNQTVR